MLLKMIGTVTIHNCSKYRNVPSQSFRTCCCRAQKRLIRRYSDSFVYRVHLHRPTFKFCWRQSTYTIHISGDNKFLNKRLR
jgi:hypothetical protein